MCGIAAILSFNKKSIDTKKLNVLSNSILNRGPDNQSSWLNRDGTLGLTVARLATKDKRKIANQPCFSSSKNSITIMNGEIYNYKKLKELLINHKVSFKSKNDTEVLVNGLELFGPNFLKKIEGQFAFIYYNLKTEKIYAGRDHFGICPIYYSINKYQIILCSSPEGIYNIKEFKKKINYQAIVDFHLSDSVSNGSTIFKNINYLKNNQICEIDHKKKKVDFKNIESNFSKNFIIDSTSKNIVKKKILSIFRNSVKNTFYGDKKVGVFLSGGIDSFSILSMLKKIYPKKKIHTFTANFQDIFKKKLIVGEGNLAKKFSKQFNSIHHNIIIKEKDLLSYIKNAPLPCSTLIDATVDKLSKVAKKYKVEVILSGEGADEMFYGYDHFLAVIGNLKNKYSFLKSKYSLRGDYAKKKSAKKIFNIFLGGGTNIDENNNYKKIFLKKTLKKTNNYRISLLNHFSNYSNFRKLRVENALPFIDYNLKVPENLLRRAETPSMSNGVEMRFPYLSKELLKYVSRIPLKLKIGDGETKSLLRETLKEILPKQIIDYPKTPFGVPASRTSHFKTSKKLFDQPAFKYLMYKNKKRIKKLLFYGKLEKLNIFKTSYLSKIIKKQNKKDTGYFDHTLWKIWSLSEWLEKKY